MLEFYWKKSPNFIGFGFIGLGLLACAVYVVLLKAGVVIAPALAVAKDGWSWLLMFLLLGVSFTAISVGTMVVKHRRRQLAERLRLTGRKVTAPISSIHDGRTRVDKVNLLVVEARTTDGHWYISNEVFPNDIDGLMSGSPIDIYVDSADPTKYLFDFPMPAPKQPSV